jgi:hypothetical protein
MSGGLLSAHVATAVGVSLILWSLSSEGHEASVTLLFGMGCLSFAMGVLWARRPWNHASAPGAANTKD